ncbi:tetratricopeptide repeat protein [Tenacibaculum ovolyticum]|uniref:tetratricopeptide repeat-containing sensor histidine kinase n=1 Tax=Tenacibaculum ovolyticum TaxID=104270 RepID=UPI0022F3D1B4|nr:histidine kinase [Tenacibaculum ovolyticum]WBX77153.1 tetratricopeptide repeat protein [Tenacibaculum ovolyticum]
MYSTFKRFLQVVFVFVFCVFAIRCSKPNSIRPVLEKQLLTLQEDSQKQPEKAIKKIDSLLLNVTDLNTAEEALLLFEKGEVYYLNDEFIEAKNIHLKTYTLFSKFNDNYNKGRSLITLSNTCIKLREFEKAQEYAIEALHIGELINNNRLQAKANNQLFQLHFRLKDYKKALAYINQSEKLFLNSEDITSIIAVKGNIATIHLQLKEYNKALQKFSETLKLSEKIKDPKTIVRVLNNIGFTYLEAREFKQSEKFLRGAITLNKNIKAINAAPYKGLGALFLVTNRLDSAKINYKKALNIYKDKGNIEEETDIRDKLIAVALLEKNFEEALFHQTIRDSVKIQLNKSEKEKLLHFANVNYKVKEKEIALKHQKETSKQNMFLGVSVIVSLVLLLIIAVFFNYNNKLRALNKASKLEQRLLRVQMNPHFIFNTLAAIQNIILEGNPLKSSNYIAKFSKLIRQNFDYVRKEEISLEEEIKMISNYIETQQLRFNNAFKYTIDISENCNIKELKMPPMLLQPFVENAIEYGLKGKKTDGVLALKIDKEKDGLYFEILDNGVGRTIKQKDVKVSEKLHATAVFIERLKTRDKGEEKSFTIEDLYNDEKKSIGTKVFFKLTV